MNVPINIVLIGFMGCGKTTVGSIVAKKLRWGFVDTDHLITQRAGRSIPVLFAEEGEQGFRARETEVLERLVAKRYKVISTGGGIVTQPINEDKLKQLGFVVWLNATEEAIYERVSRNQNRPLLQTPNPRQTIRDLLAQRRPLYQRFAHLTVETSGFEPEEIAYGVMESAQHFFGHQNELPPADEPPPQEGSEPLSSSDAPE